METARAAGRVAKEEHERLAVCQAALGHIVDGVRHRAVLVKDVKAGTVGGVLPGKRLRVLLSARLHRAEPTRFVLVVIHALARHTKPVFGQTQPRPMPHRGPGLVAQLRERIGGHGALRLWAR